MEKLGNYLYSYDLYDVHTPVAGSFPLKLKSLKQGTVSEIFLNIFQFGSSNSSLTVIDVKKKFIVAVAILLIVISSAVGILSASLGLVQESNSFTYPLSVGDKTFIVTVETNWDAEDAPTVSLLNSSDSTRHEVELYFRGGSKRTIFYNNTIPTDLLWGNVSLTRKYYLQDPDRYTLSNNSTHNSLQMTFDYDPFFSGSGYFLILGTEGAW
jgi:hypothetical protein